jgi:hypothetical protein
VKGIVPVKLPDPRWGEPTIARVIPTEDGGAWGALNFLVGTDWVLGPPPKALVKRLPVVETPCAQRRSCVSHTPLCVPGPKLPDCWESPTFTGAEANLVNLVVCYWRDGVVVLVEAR